MSWELVVGKLGNCIWKFGMIRRAIFEIFESGAQTSATTMSARWGFYVVEGKKCVSNMTNIVLIALFRSNCVGSLHAPLTFPPLKCLLFQWPFQNNWITTNSLRLFSRVQVLQTGNFLSLYFSHFLWCIDFFIVPIIMIKNQQGKFGFVFFFYCVAKVSVQLLFFRCSESNHLYSGVKKMWSGRHCVICWF